MIALAKISSPSPRRRLPLPYFGVDLNFCRNPQCELFMEPPDPYDNRGKSSGKVKPNQPRGEVTGSGDEKSFKCGACAQHSIIKNNKAVVQEYRRLWKRFRLESPRHTGPKPECVNHEKSLGEFPDFYRKTGKTPKKSQRWKCETCLASFSVSSRIRRQHRSNANREVLWMITNGMPISKISDFTGLCPRDVYRKIDFIYDRVVDLNARREGTFNAIDWTTVGRRFASASQTLYLN